MYLVPAGNQNDSSGLQPYTVSVLQFTIFIFSTIVRQDLHYFSQDLLVSH